MIYFKTHGLIFPLVCTLPIIYMNAKWEHATSIFQPFCIGIKDGIRCGAGKNLAPRVLLNLTYLKSESNGLKPDITVIQMGSVTPFQCLLPQYYQAVWGTWKENSPFSNIKNLKWNLLHLPPYRIVVWVSNLTPMDSCLSTRRETSFTEKNEKIFYSTAAETVGGSESATPLMWKKWMEGYFSYNATEHKHIFSTVSKAHCRANQPILNSPGRYCR